MKKSKRKKFNFKKAFIIIIISCFTLACILTYAAYYMLYQPAFNLGEENKIYVYIPTGADFEKVKSIFYEKDYIKNRRKFEWLAKLKKYPSHVKPGRYLINKDMSMNALINMLRSGKQDAVKLVFNNIRTKEQFVQRICSQIEADSSQLLNILTNGPFLEKYNLSPINIMVMFLPNTYEFYWNTSAEQFMDRMHREYLKFWNEERLDKAANMGLTAIDISVLASIVQSETTKKDEMSRIAGVYINRLNKGMLLQADPTVIFAWQDFTIKRVLHKHLQIESPYNTYKYSGLPPGPITVANPSTIDKVLDYEKHNYLFFCAKDDLSGYHTFAVTHNEHINNAKKFQKELNKLNIR